MTESREDIPTCLAFDIIPEDIVDGKNLHKTVQPNQKGEFVYEKATDEEWEEIS